MITACEKYAGTAAQQVLIDGCARAAQPCVVGLAARARTGRAATAPGTASRSRSPSSRGSRSGSAARSRSGSSSRSSLGVATLLAWTVTSISPETPVTCSSVCRSRSAGMFDGTSLVTSDCTAVWVSATQPSDGEHERRPRARARAARTDAGQQSTRRRPDARPRAERRRRTASRRRARSDGRQHRERSTRRARISAAPRSDAPTQPAVAVGEHQRRRARRSARTRARPRSRRRAAPRSRGPSAPARAAAPGSRSRWPAPRWRSSARPSPAARATALGDAGPSPTLRPRASCTRDWNWIA